MPWLCMDTVHGHCAQEQRGGRPLLLATVLVTLLPVYRFARSSWDSPQSSADLEKNPPPTDPSGKEVGALAGGASRPTTAAAGSSRPTTTKANAPPPPPPRALHEGDRVLFR